MSPAARILTRQVVPWTVTAALATLAVTFLANTMVVLTTDQTFAETLSPAAAQAAIAACGVVAAMFLWLRCAPWLTAGARRVDIATTLTIVTAVDTLAIVSAVVLAGLATGPGIEAGVLARTALTAVAVHVGGILTVISFAAIGGWRSTVLLLLTLPIAPWAAITLEGRATDIVLTLLHVAWLAPAMLIVPFALRRMPAPRRIA